MARQNTDTQWVEEIFAQNQSVIFHKMQEIVEKKRCVLELKSKICISEEQKHKLKEYVKYLETIIRKSSQFEVLIPNLTSKIGELEKSITNYKKDIAVLESERKIEVKPKESNKKLVLNMKKMLSELYNNNFDLLIQKENTLFQLKEQLKECNASVIFKEKKELNSYITEYELLKAKNMRLKEMIDMNIQQKM